MINGDGSRRRSISHNGRETPPNAAAASKTLVVAVVSETAAVAVVSKILPVVVVISYQKNQGFITIAIKGAAPPPFKQGPLDLWLLRETTKIRVWAFFY